METSKRTWKHELKINVVGVEMNAKGITCFVKIILSGYHVMVASVKFCAIRFALNCKGRIQYRYFRFISSTDHDKRMTEDGSSITDEDGLHS